MPLTPTDVRRIVGQRLGETQGTPGGDDPFLYMDITQRVVTNIARRTFCLHTYRTTDLVANQNAYCIPDLLRFTSAMVMYSDNKYYNLPNMPVWIYDQRCGTNWREATAVDPPCILLTTSDASNFYLAPTPSISRTNGIRLEGFYAPTSVWSYDEDGLPETITATSNIPLPGRMEEIVLDGVTIERYLMFPTKEREGFLKLVADRYESAIRREEGLARTAWKSDARRSPGGGSWAGGWY